MSKSLEERLQDARNTLGRVDAAVLRHQSKLPSEVVDQVRKVTAFSIDIEHWISMIRARSVARQWLSDLDLDIDAEDLVPLGNGRAKYQQVRLISVQGYLATKWALADRLAGMAGRVLCTPEVAFDVSRPVQLVTQFVKKDRKKSTTGAVYETIQKTFGWPIGISYALRNHFFHEGGQITGSDFFVAPSSASRFAISVDGWDRLEEAARSYSVDPTNHRAGAAWPATPCDDLRAVLDVCERETDDALGVLIGSACHTLVSHIAFLVGED